MHKDLLLALVGNLCRLLYLGQTTWSTCLHLLVCSNFAISVSFSFVEEFPCQFLLLGRLGWSTYLVLWVYHGLLIFISFDSTEGFLSRFHSTASSLIYFCIAWGSYGGRFSTHDPNQLSCYPFREINPSRENRVCKFLYIVLCVQVRYITILLTKIN